MEYERWFVFLNKGFGVMKITDSQGSGSLLTLTGLARVVCLYYFLVNHSAPIPSLKEKKNSSTLSFWTLSQIQCSWG